MKNKTLKLIRKELLHFVVMIGGMSIGIVLAFGIWLLYGFFVR
jgi:hypothetical protein